MKNNGSKNGLKNGVKNGAKNGFKKEAGLIAESPIKIATASKKPRILLVEDDALTRESVLIKLNRSGFKTEFAEDGDSGLKKLRNQGPYAAVLLDLVMPNGDGFKFLKEKRDDPKIKDTMVIVFTNLSQKEQIKRAADLGAHGYLIKAHHSLQDIVKKLNQCLTDIKQCPIDYSDQPES